MAIVNTPNLISGRIGGLIYYVRDGKQCVRSMPVHDKKKHASAPTMEPVRRHNAEFSAASRAGAAFRAALGSWRKAYSDTPFSGKVTSIMYHIVSNAKGEKGRRPLHIRDSAQLFNRLPLNASRAFSSVAGNLVQHLDAKALVNLKMSELRGDLSLEGATSYRWVTLAFSVPDYEYSDKTHQYEPVQVVPAPTEVVGEWMSLSKADASLQMNFPMLPQHAQFLALGLEVGRQTGAGIEVMRDLSMMEIFNLQPMEGMQHGGVLSTDTAKLEEIAEPITVLPKLNEIPTSQDIPEVRLRKLEEVPVELVLPESSEDLDLDFEPTRFERIAPPSAVEVTASLPTVTEIAVDSPVAESMGTAEEVAAPKAKKERKARPAKEEAAAEAKPKAEKVKSDSGQLSLFF